MNQIIGITGMSAAGKGTVVEILKKKGFVHFSVGDFLMEEVIKRGLPQNRDSMIEVGNDLRSKNGPGYILEQLITKAKLVDKSLIESIRCPGEVAVLKQNGGRLLAIDAPLELRYQRAIARGSSKDQVTLEKFKEQELLESQSSDPNKQNLIGVRQMADWVINNEGTMEELMVKIDQWMEKI